MSRIDPKHRGKLLPGIAATHRRTLASYRRDARRVGILIRVEILGPGKGQCPVVDAQRGEVYSLDEVPKLPLKGCVRSPCCACCYAPVTK